MHEASADVLSRDGICTEIIDLCSLWPWDKTAVCDSVRHTGRLLVAHEAVAVGGFAGRGGGHGG